VWAAESTNSNIWRPPAVKKKRFHIVPGNSIVIPEALASFQNPSATSQKSLRFDWGYLAHDAEQHTVGETVKA
jgi:hypothetical protein